jgi:hypothetical protein
MRWLRFSALMVMACSACTQQPGWSRPGASRAHFEADHGHCAGVMYAARRARGAPDWHVYDFCMEQRGYRRGARPA